MPTIRIDLREGFDDDRVRVTVDGTTVLEDAVTTDYSIGLARSVEHDVPAGEHVVAVHCGGHRSTREVTVESTAVHLDVLLDEERPSIARHRGPDRFF